jgi:hypothetical protein
VRVPHEDSERQLYWRGPIEVRVEKQDIAKVFELSKNLAKLLVRAKQPLAAQVAEAVSSVEVPDTAVGLLMVDGEFVKVLEPGLHAFWKYHRGLKTELADRRVQAMEVAGQEILTRDKVNQVVEAEKVAQANLIKRREETAATRSLLNTARLMDENPTLLRLKELETLEKVTEKIDKLTVFGGLDGVLKDVVRIRVPAA